MYYLAYARNCDMCLKDEKNYTVSLAKELIPQKGRRRAYSNKKS